MLFSSIAFAFNAVMPIVLLIALGYVLRQKGRFDDAFVKKANWFNYRFGLSLLLFCNVYALDGIADIPWKLALFVLAVLTLFVLLGMLEARLVTPVRPRQGVLVQNAFRSNMAVIGLPLASSMAGAEGIMVASSLQAPTVIFFNLVAVVVLAVYSGGTAKVDYRHVLKKIVTNPLILGLAAGVVCLAVRSAEPLGADGLPLFTLKKDLPFLFTAVSNLGKMGSPLALVLLGGQFRFAAVHESKKEIIAGVVGRLIISPTVGFAAAFAAARLGVIEMSPAVVAALVGVFASPAAVSSSVTATEMNCDAELAGQLTVWTCIGSIFTLFVLVTALRTVGLL